MTMNDSWGYQKADDDWKTPKTDRAQPGHLRARRRQLPAEHRPESRTAPFPEESVRILTAVGKWMDNNGQTIYDAETLPVAEFPLREFHAQGQHALHARVLLARRDGGDWRPRRRRCRSAKLLATGKSVNFKQEDFRVQFTGLPAAPPDSPVTVIAVECDSEPVQDTLNVRKNRPRPSKA